MKSKEEINAIEDTILLLRGSICIEELYPIKKIISIEKDGFKVSIILYFKSEEIKGRYYNALYIIKEESKFPHTCIIQSSMKLIKRVRAE